MESLSGSTHVLFLSNRNKITQILEFHDAPTIPCRYTKEPTKYDANVPRRESPECESIEERAARAGMASIPRLSTMVRRSLLPGVAYVPDSTRLPENYELFGEM